MDKYINADKLYHNIPAGAPYRGALRRILTQAPAADIVPWDWLEKFAEGKRYNYLSDFLIEAKVVFYRELVKEADQ